MIKEKAGKVYSFADENIPIEGCTTSKELWSAGDDYICCFSLAKDTDISAEIYSYNKLLMVLSGEVEVYMPRLKKTQSVAAGKCILTLADTPVGIRTATVTVYVEMSIWRDTFMNKAIKAGEVFNLSELVPYQDGRIVNMDVVHNDKMKFVIMAFDEGTRLSEHAAPGDALIFALDGEGIIGYEGEGHKIKAGENFKFAGGGKHYVKADGRFKMALLLMLE